MIDWEDLGPYLRNKNFPKYGIFLGIQQTIQIFISEEIQQKLMTKFFNKSERRNDERMDARTGRAKGLKEKQTLFYRTLSAIAGGPSREYVSYFDLC